MTIATYLDQTLRAAGIPIVGVSVRDPLDRATWIVTFQPQATDEQRAQAAQIVAGQVITPATLSDADASEQMNANKVIRAIVIWAAQRFGITPNQARQEILAIYRNL